MREELRAIQAKMDVFFDDEAKVNHMNMGDSVVTEFFVLAAELNDAVREDIKDLQEEL